MTGWTDAEKNPFTYRGYFYYHQLGMYYLGTRWYDPVIGRFISPDKYVSTGQGILGHNMYAYCNNNPVNFVDPSGEFASGILISAVVGGIIGAASGMISAKMNGTSITAGAISGALTGAAIGVVCETAIILSASAGAAASMILLAGIVVSGGVGVAGNIINQYINYSEGISNGTVDSNTSFEEGFDRESAVYAGINGAISGALGIGAGTIVSSAFPEEVLSIADAFAKGIASMWVGGNASLISMGIDIVAQEVIVSWSK